MDEAARGGAASSAITLGLLERLLAPAGDALDVRAVLDRLFECAQAGLAHDGMSISFVTPDREHIQLYATSGALRDLPLRLESPLADPTLLTRAWDHELIDDQSGDARYRDMPSARAGMRSAIVIPLRFAGQLRGWVNFFSRAPRAFTAADAPAARRAAAHVALTLSYEVLEDHGRRHEILRARAANLALLEALLATLPDSGDVPALLERVSTMAGKVLAHDAALLSVYLPDRRRARIHGTGAIAAGLPPIVDLPGDLVEDPDRDGEVIGDLAIRSEARFVALHEQGYSAVLRVPIQFERHTVGALLLLSRTPDAFDEPDRLVASRLASRLAVAIARSDEVEAARRADEATERATRLEARVRALTEELDARTGYRRVVGDSPPWRQVLTQATQAAPTEATVLLLGESGTGKEVVARFIHRASPRSRGPFVALNCAALPEHLLEAELFGYERGAFTGAMQSKPGHLEQASGGTLFLDEVGEMSLAAQAKFLRVLQEREFQRLGGTRVLRTDTRIVAATNRDLLKAIAHNQFREDLYYRLNVFALRLPPLRERAADILPLSDAFLVEFGKSMGRPPAGISRAGRDALVGYHWPGNVRELRNILERAAILCDGGLIADEHLAISRPTPAVGLPAPTNASSKTDDGAAGSAADLASMERAMIENALQQSRFNKSKAAQTLGLTRHQLYIRMRRHGLA